jgi:hypothetical protein
LDDEHKPADASPDSDGHDGDHGNRSMDIAGFADCRASGVRRPGDTERADAAPSLFGDPEGRVRRLHVSIDRSHRDRRNSSMGTLVTIIIVVLAIIGLLAILRGRRVL